MKTKKNLLIILFCISAILLLMSCGIDRKCPAYSHVVTQTAEDRV